MGFMDKFGTGQGWLAQTFGRKTPQQTPQNIHTEVDSTMNDYNKTQSAFTQPTETQPFTPNLGQQVSTPGNEAVNQNTMATGPQSNPYIDKTQFFEGGHKNKAYLDSEGYPTIGTGTLLEHQKYETMPDQYANLDWSEEQGNQRFQEDYGIKQGEVQNLYGEGWESLPPQVQGRLTDMSYNVGSQGLFNKFPGLIKDIRAGNYQDAANQLKYKDISKGDVEGNISQWWDQVGGVTTEGNIASGAWGGDSRSGNRATYNYDTLYNLGNQSNTIAGI